MQRPLKLLVTAPRLHPTAANMKEKPRPDRRKSGRQRVTIKTRQKGPLARNPVVAVEVEVEAADEANQLQPNPNVRILKLLRLLRRNSFARVALLCDDLNGLQRLDWLRHCRSITLVLSYTILTT